MRNIFTHTGDDGKTGLLGEGRVEKFDLRMETLGTIDELTAQLGFSRSVMQSPQENEMIVGIQRDLYALMAEVAATKENAAKFLKIGIESIQSLETCIDEISMKVEIPTGFIVPGDNSASASVSIARAVARRAERRVAELLSRGDIANPFLLIYLNRLSSLLFVLENSLVHRDGKILATPAKGK